MKFLYNNPLIIFLLIICGIIVLMTTFNTMFVDGLSPMANAFISVIFIILFLYMIKGNIDKTSTILGYEINVGFGVYIAILLFIFFSLSGN